MLAPLSGKPLLLHTIERMRPQVAGLALNGEAGEYDGFGLSVFPDVIAGKLGPLVGILTAMLWARELGYERVLTVSGDTPFVPLNWAEKLSQTPNNVIAIPIVDGQNHQVCCLWPVALAANLQSFLQTGDSYKVRDFLQTQVVQHADFPMQNDIDPFFNVNTQEDMGKARGYGFT
jgi:molybdenum cofactor guanylyltransferase